MTRYCSILLLCLYWSFLLPGVSLGQTRHSLMQEDVGLINALHYGDGVSKTAATITAALTGIAALGNPPVTLWLPTGAWTVGTSLTMPANVTLWIPRGTTVALAGGTTLTLAACPRFDDFAWHSGTGKILIQGCPTDMRTLATGGVGTTASPWTGWDTALASCGSGTTLQFPAGTYTQTVPMTCNGRDVHIAGAGQRQTQLNYTGAAGVAWTMGAVGGESFWNTFKGLSIDNTGGNIVTVLQLIDQSSFVLTDFFLTGYIAMQTRGREIIMVSNGTLQGNQPLLFSQNPNVGGGQEAGDIVTFNNVIFKATDATKPVVNFAAGAMTLRQLTFRDCFASGGSTGIYWHDAAGSGLYIRIINWRWEQSSSPGGYAIDLVTGGIEHLEIDGFVGGEGSSAENGIKLTNTFFFSLNHALFNGSGANVFLNIDATVAPTTLSHIKYAGATVTLGTLIPIMQAPPSFLDLFAVGLVSSIFAVYDNRANVYGPGNMQISRSSNNPGEEEFLSMGFNGSRGATPNGCVLVTVSETNGDKSLVIRCSASNAAAVEVARFKVTTGGNTSVLKLVGVPVFANNAGAVAGGMGVGSIYRTSGDPDLLAVVH